MHYRFVDMFVSAVESVVHISPETVQRLTNILHFLDGAVANPNLPGCSKGTPGLARSPSCRLEQRDSCAACSGAQAHG